MARQSTRYFRFAPARRSRLAQSYHLRCESLESRTTPALFNVQSSVSVSPNGNYGCVATGDFNNDGKSDMVLTNYGTTPPGQNGGGDTISILLGAGNGTFGSASNITIAANQYVSFVAVGDLNGDNKQDLAVVSNNEDSTGRLSIYLGTGLGGFTPSAQNPISTGSSNACWVGFAQMTNGDTNLDVVVCGFGDSDEGETTIFGNNINVFQGNGAGAVSSIGTISNGLAFIPTALALADFDGDGDTDIAATVPGVPPDVSEPQPPGLVQMFNGNGAGGFTLGNSTSSGGALPISIQAAHLNGDSLPDLVVANAGDPDGANFYVNFGINSSVGVLTNVGGGSFNANSLTAGLGVSGSKSVFAVAVADFDVDGKQDIAGIVYGHPLSAANARILEYKGDGAGGFAADANSPYNTLTTDGQYLAVAPLDANTTPDIVYSTAGGRYGVLLNTTVPAATTSVSTPSSSADPSIVGQQVTFTVTVSSPSGTVTGGTVQFRANGNPIGSPVSLVNEQAQVSIGSLPVGDHAITATYSGAPGFAGSTSGTLTQDVDPQPVGPTVTINQANGQADPTSVPSVQFTVLFNEPVTGFDGSDMALSGTVGGSLSAAVSGSGAAYTVTVTGMTGSGTVVASVPAGVAVNGSAVPNQASTSTDNTVTFDNVRPTVTINQAAGQADPTTGSEIKFDVVFSEPVTGFTIGDVAVSGTAGQNLVVSDLTGSGTTYEVTVQGMTSPGTVTATVLDGAAQDTLGNTSQSSTSIDNTVTYQTSSVIGFTDIRYNTSELDGSNTATITVTRTGQLGGTASVRYRTIAGGTANTVVGSNPVDYVQIDPVIDLNNILTWNDNEGGDKTFTVTIQPDALNEGMELINLLLYNPSGTGSTSVGQPNATLAIDPSDGQVINAAAVRPQRPFAKFTDTDGDVATVRLAGRQGTATVYRTDPDGNGSGPIELIELSNTLPDPLRPRAVLTVGVTKGKFTVDGGTVGLGAITGSGLRAIQARRANLNGDGINLNGYLGSLMIGNIINGADITTGATSNPLQKTRINALAIQHGTSIDVGAHVSSLTALSFGNGSFRAPSAGTIVVREVMSADVTLTGVGVDPAKYTLGALRVRGTVIDSHIEVNGHVRAVTVGSFRDSQLFVGYNGSVVPTAAGFTSSFLVGSFRTTAKFDAFQNSHVIATAFKSVFLSSLDSSNPTNFGFYADSSLGSIRVGGLLPFSYNATLPTPQRRDQFEVVLVEV